MREIRPPYKNAMLDEFSDNISRIPEGYPEFSDRWYVPLDAIDEYLDGDVLFVPPGHDALNSPNRLHAPEVAKDRMDPQIITGSDEVISEERAELFRRHGYLLDVHNRPIHPGYRQLLALTKDGIPLGMPTSIGRFHYYGRNGVADGLVFRQGQQGDEVLLVRRPDSGQWATPGGYEEPEDLSADEDPAIAASRREVFEETGIAVRGIGKVVANMLPVSSVHTLNAWSETNAVLLAPQDRAELYDVPLQAGEEVTDVGWFRVGDVINRVVDMWSNDHIRYIKEGYRLHRESKR